MTFKCKLAKRLLLFLFITVVCMPWLWWLLLGSFMGTTNQENRTMAAKPALTADTYLTYTADFETYFNDHLPFRSSLITLNSRINYYLFGTTEGGSVIAGKEGWLLYKNVSDGNPTACYQGTNLLTDEQLAAIADNLICNRDALAERGTEFIVFIAPNKERIYSEMMPDYYGQPAEEYAVLQIVQYLQANTDICVVYPYQELMDAKAALNGRNIYCKLDTHWNALGGYVGSAALLKELGISMPELTDEGMEILEIPNEKSDLAGMIHLSSELIDRDVGYSVSGYDAHGMVNDQWDYLTKLSYHTVSGADPRKLFVVRDSFGSAMADYLGSQFYESDMVLISAYTGADISAEAPDIFVLETAERYAAARLGTFDVEAQ